MAQEPCIGLYKPCIKLPFGDCAMYFDHKAYDCWLSGKTRAKTHIYSKKNGPSPKERIVVPSTVFQATC